MDSLFQKMLAESNTEIETNVDIVFVIDVTKSMERMIDIIQTAAISFLGVVAVNENIRFRVDFSEHTAHDIPLALLVLVAN